MTSISDLTEKEASLYKEWGHDVSATGGPFLLLGTEETGNTTTYRWN